MFLIAYRQSCMSNMNLTSNINDLTGTTQTFTGGSHPPTIIEHLTKIIISLIYSQSEHVPSVIIHAYTPVSPLYSAEEQCRLRESKRHLPLPGGGASSVLSVTSGSLHSAGGLLHPAASSHRGRHQSR